MESAKIKAFYAFPSKPESLVETIHEACKKIKKRTAIDIFLWNELRPNGLIIIDHILGKINKTNLFCCDISGLNPNVLFELGYALAKGKRIWMTLSKIDRNNIKLVKNVDVLDSIGYQLHINDDDIANNFIKDSPYSDLGNNILDDYKGIIESLEADGDSRTDIIYFKSTLEHTASKRLTQMLTSFHRKLQQYDILENSYQSLETCLIEILRARIFIAHLLDNNQIERTVINAKYSLFAGLALGFGKDVMLVAPEPYDSPFDYKNILVKHNTAAECTEKVKNWIQPILSKGEKGRKSTVPLPEKTDLTLIKFILGDGQAEHEEDELDDYFVETSQYNTGLNSSIAVFVGRKGSGKTANLFRIRDYFSRENTNIIALIKPISFKLETYVKLIRIYFNETDIQSELTEKIWEFIIYTAIAYEIYLKLKNKKDYYEYSDEENMFINYVEERSSIITADFGEKLDYVFEQTKELTEQGNTPKKVLEIVFNEYLNEIRKYFTILIKNTQKVVILVDNLDKAWDFGKEVDLQCKIIFGLIGFHNELVKKLNSGKSNTKLHVFLREDIFKYVKKLAREPDKIQLNTHRIEWDDKELLLRVVEERFIYFDNSLTNKNVWDKLFCETVSGKATRDYIYSSIIPRPRDLIFFVQLAINESINHQNKRIEENDIIKATEKYFEYSISNTITEYKLFFPNIDKLLLGFYGCNQRISESKLISIIKNCSITEFPIQEIVRLLIEVSFLGIIVNSESKFAYSTTEAEKIYNYYLTNTKKHFSKMIFVIHPAFHGGL